MPSYAKLQPYLLTAACLLAVAVSCTSYRIHCTRCSPVFGGVNGIRTSPAEMFAERTVSWEMQNIMFASSDRSLNKFNDFDESTMLVTATLYDDALISARIDSCAAGDSIVLDTLSARYGSEHRPDKYLRIHVALEAFFARKSIDPGIWTIYLQDENGDMYEPERVSRPVTTVNTVTADRTMQGPRSRYRAGFDIYFSRTTFYGQPLIPEDRAYLKLVFSHERQIVGEGGWCFTD